jgi:molybdopterin converting factor small subunit
VTAVQEMMMPIRVEIPGPLREQAGGNTEVAVTGNTVGAVLADLVKQYPALEPKLFQNGAIRPYINVFVNDEDIRYLDEMDTTVTDGVVVALIPAVAGG